MNIEQKELLKTIRSSFSILVSAVSTIDIGEDVLCGLPEANAKDVAEKQIARIRTSLDELTKLISPGV